MCADLENMASGVPGGKQPLTRPHSGGHPLPTGEGYSFPEGRDAFRPRSIGALSRRSAPSIRGKSRTLLDLNLPRVFEGHVRLAAIDADESGDANIFVPVLFLGLAEAGAVTAPDDCGEDLVGKGPATDPSPVRTLADTLSPRRGLKLQRESVR